MSAFGEPKGSGPMPYWKTIALTSAYVALILGALYFQSHFS